MTKERISELGDISIESSKTKSKQNKKPKRTKTLKTDQNISGTSTKGVT